MCNKFQRTSSNDQVRWYHRMPVYHCIIIDCTEAVLSSRAPDEHKTTCISQSEIYRRGNVENGWKSLIMVDHAWKCQWSKKIENWLTSIIQGFFYIVKCNFKQQWPSLAFTSVLYMVMKIIVIPTVVDDSQLLADYHWHFHAYPMILTVYAIDYFLNFENKRTLTHAGDNLQYNISTE